MSEEPKYLVRMNFNRVDLHSWIEQRKRPDGDYDLIGMGRRIEWDYETGALVSDVTEPTGLNGWAPCEFVESKNAIKGLFAQLQRLWEAA